MPPLTLDGTTGVSAVQAGAVESGDLPAGSVIQVVQAATDTAIVTTANNTLIDTGLEATITPTSSNSKIFVLFSLVAQFGAISNSGDEARAVFQLLRNSTEISTNASSADKLLRIKASRVGGETVFSGYHSHCFLDSPNSSSNVTYKVRGGLTTPGNFIRFQEQNNTSTLVLMEIAG